MWCMLKRLKRRGGNALCRKGRGDTLIEVLLAVVVLGFLVVAVPPAMVAVVNAQFQQSQLNLAQNLSQSQFEYIKAQPYNPYPWSSFPPYNQVQPPSGYSMQVAYNLIDPSTGNITSVDKGVQMVTITVFGWQGNAQGDLRYILVTTDYKVNRSLQISGYGVSG